VREGDNSRLGTRLSQGARRRSTLRTVLATLLAAAAIASAPASASAQTRDPKKAEELFQEGKRQFEANDLVSACATLRQSDQLDPAIGTHGLLAACYEKQGKIAQALAAYRETQSRARAAADNREAFAKERADALEPQVPRLRVVALGNEAGLEILVDGTPIRAGEPTPLDPGDHQLVARAPGRKDNTTRVTLKAGDRVDTSLPALQSTEAAVVPTATTRETPPPPPPDEQPDDGSSRRTVGIVVAGAGLVGIAVGAVFGVMTLSNASEANKLQEDCAGGGDCNKTDYDEKVDDRDSTGMASNVGFIVGGLAVVAGAVLYFTAPSAPEKAAAKARPASGLTVRVLPSVGARSGGATVLGSF
jgi:hypothetical protein